MYIMLLLFFVVCVCFVLCRKRRRDGSRCRLITERAKTDEISVKILKGSILISIPFKTKNKNMQNDMRKGGIARTDETRSLCYLIR